VVRSAIRNRWQLRYERESLDNTWMIGAGVGYKFNRYFRSDVTVDYEAKATATGYAPCGGCTAAGQFSTEKADIDVWTVMLNGYVDLATWNRITPYVGAGIGAAYVSTSNKTSVNPDGTFVQLRRQQRRMEFRLGLDGRCRIRCSRRIGASMPGTGIRTSATAKTVKLYNVGTGESRDQCGKI
jgi:opacity protein-like surface antigen